MKPVVTSLLLLLGTALHADPAWEKKVIGDVRIEVPTDSKTDVQNTPGAGGAVQKMTKYLISHSCARSGIGLSHVST